MRSRKPLHPRALKWAKVQPIQGVPLNSRLNVAIVQQPRLLPWNYFRGVQAPLRWFKSIDSRGKKYALNMEALRPYASTKVPLEYSGPDPTTPSRNVFKRFEAPLSLLLDYIEKPPSGVSIYLAQCSISGLPAGMRRSLEIPNFIQENGLRKPNNEYDIYDTSLWMGLPPTYTPLHRDPNPNCFYQLAGEKIVRLLPPEKGLELFQQVRAKIGMNDGHMSGNIRGEEMMTGPEREQLESAVWDAAYDPESGGLEARLSRAQGLFIPEGWWHSVKGVGSDVTASVNWWFRMRKLPTQHRIPQWKLELNGGPKQRREGPQSWLPLGNKRPG